MALIEPVQVKRGYCGCAPEELGALWDEPHGQIDKAIAARRSGIIRLG
jgi:hypothetical protein